MTESLRAQNLAQKFGGAKTGRTSAQGTCHTKCMAASPILNVQLLLTLSCMILTSPPPPPPRPCIDILGVANLSLACQPCAPLVTLQSRPPPSIPHTSLCELSSSSLYPILAVLWRLAVRIRRLVEAKCLERVFCAAVVSTPSSAFELVMRQE